MRYSSWTLEPAEERGIYILNMQRLQISHPCIIIYAMQGAAVKHLIPAACENENLLFHNQISVLLSHGALFVLDYASLSTMKVPSTSQGKEKLSFKEIRRDLHLNFG